MIQRDADEEHGQTPAQAAEHSLVAVSGQRGEMQRDVSMAKQAFLPIRVLAQQSDDSRVSKSDGRGREEFPDDHQQQQEEEGFLDVLDKRQLLADRVEKLFEKRSNVPVICTRSS